MQFLEMIIQNPTGLHARPAKIFVNIAKKYQSDVRVFHGEKKANAKSLISMLTLGVEKGTKIRIEVDGEDEQAALKALEEAILSGLGEEELLEQPAQEKEIKGAASSPAEEKVPQFDAGNLPVNKIQGVPGATGIAIGQVYHLKLLLLRGWINPSKKKKLCP